MGSRPRAKEKPLYPNLAMRFFLSLFPFRLAFILGGGVSTPQKTYSLRPAPPAAAVSFSAHANTHTHPLPRSLPPSSFSSVFSSDRHSSPPPPSI